MSLTPITSCDYVTELPLCSDSGLPVFREFTDREIEALRSIVKTDAFAAAKARSPYYLAWFVEDRLRGRESPIKVNLLTHGLARDSRNTLSDPAYMDLVIAEIESIIPVLSEEDRPFHWALLAFLLFHTDRPDEASTHLERAKTAGRTQGRDFSTYVKAVELCLSNQDEIFCRPDTPVTQTMRFKSRQ